MSQQMLAEEVVRITVEGLERAEQRLDAVEKKFNKTSEAAKKAKGFFGQLSESIDKIGKAAKLFAAGGALGLGGIAAIAMRGTVQAERFGRAIELAGRALGDGLAPYIEAATSGIMGLTNAWAGLSQETRDAATKWAIITTAVAGFLALLPAIVAGFAAVGGAIAAILSPVGVAIAGMALLGVAAVKLFNLFQDGGADAADSLNASNKGWIESLASGIAAVTKVVADLFNFIMRKAAQVSDWIAEQIAGCGEVLGLLPSGTLDQLGKMDPIKAPQIDVSKIDAFFDQVQRRAKQADADFDGLAGKLGNIGADMQKAFNNPANQHMRIKLSVGWESLQGTFDRLQKSFADQSGLNFQKAQLGQLQAINNGQQAAVAELGQIKDLLPVVR